jgi:hypothetical protein
MVPLCFHLDPLFSLCSPGDLTFPVLAIFKKIADMAEHIPNIASGLATIVQLCKWIRDAWKNDGQDIAEKFHDLSDEANNVEKHLVRLGHQPGGPQLENNFDSEHLQRMTQKTARCIKYLQLHSSDIEGRRCGRLTPVVDLTKYVLENKTMVEKFRKELKLCREQIILHMTEALYSDLILLVTMLVGKANLRL